MIRRETITALTSAFADRTGHQRVSRRDARRRAAAERWSRVLRLLKERGFDLLVDITCVDYLNYRDATDRFGLVYLLANTVDATSGSRCACS